MFLKNNKYKSLIVAVLITIVLALLAFKLIDNIDIFIAIIRKFISLSMSFVYGIVIAYVLTPIVKLFEVKAKLNLNDKHCIISMLTLGYEKEKQPANKLRKEFDEVISFEKLGCKF